MIEIIVRNKLEELLNVPVFLEQPIEKPSKYVLVERKGMGEENHLGVLYLYFKAMQSRCTSRLL